MLKLLSIGNSFSEDAHRYFYPIAKAAGEDLYAVNYCIGGCPLEKHWRLLMSGEAEYWTEINGEPTGEQKPLPEILKAEPWDIITIQQVSQEAGRPQSYEPYLENLCMTIRAMVPTAKLYFQETWEYEYSSTHPGFAFYNKDCNTMYNAISDTVRKACAEFDLHMIPSGDAVHTAKKLPEFDSEHGGQTLYLDGFHMHRVYGRYLVACVWYKTVFGKSPVGNTYVPCDGDSDPALIAALQKVANSVRA